MTNGKEGRWWQIRHFVEAADGAVSYAIVQMVVYDLVSEGVIETAGEPWDLWESSEHRVFRRSRLEKSGTVC